MLHGHTDIYSATRSKNHSYRLKDYYLYNFYTLLYLISSLLPVFVSFPCPVYILRTYICSLAGFFDAFVVLSQCLIASVLGVDCLIFIFLNKPLIFVAKKTEPFISPQTIKPSENFSQARRCQFWSSTSFLDSSLSVREGCETHLSLNSDTGVPAASNS